MSERKVNDWQCKEGDVLSRHILSLGNGMILCKKGKVITGETIAWLKNFRHTDIYIVENEWLKVWNLEEKDLKSYEDNKEKLKQILTTFRFSDEMNYDEINEVTQEVLTIFENNHSAIMGCVNMVRSVDEYTYTHSLNVGMLALVLGKWMGLPHEALEELMVAGILHDIGKYRVPEKILNKRGKLTEAEYLVMKKHVNYGYEHVKNNRHISQGVKNAILSHHERNDGKGYPRQLLGDEIPLYAKILAVVDVYDAMISERVYKKKETPFEVIGYMLTQEIDRLDPKIVLTFLQNIANYYIGTEVLLNTGERAKVVFLPQNCIYKPIVKLDETYIDLSRQNDIQIIDIV